ncbi:hypothetical protein ACJJTC_000184 [Scirpophaga incertulas]
MRWCCMCVFNFRCVVSRLLCGLRRLPRGEGGDGGGGACARGGDKCFVSVSAAPPAAAASAAAVASAAAAASADAGATPAALAASGRLAESTPDLVLDLPARAPPAPTAAPAAPTAAAHAADDAAPPADSADTFLHNRDTLRKKPPSPVPARNTARVAAKFAELTLTGGSKPAPAARPPLLRRPTPHPRPAAAAAAVAHVAHVAQHVAHVAPAAQPDPDHV